MSGLVTWAATHRLQLLAALIWILGLLALRQAMLANDLAFEDLVPQLRLLLAGTWYGPLIYGLVYLARPIILFPASLLAILAGNVYGLWLGFLYGLIAGTLSAVLPYMAGRWFVGPGERTVIQAKQTLMQRFISTLQQEPFQAVLTMRLLFLPYDTVSAITGGLKIAFIPFIGATLLGNIPGTFAFVGIGASIQGDFTAGEFSLNPGILAVSLAIFIGSLWVSRYLGRKESGYG